MAAADAPYGGLLVTLQGSGVDLTGAMKGATYTPKGYQQLTGITASTALTVPAGSRYAVIQAEAQAIRWRDDGVAPTATVGMQIPAAGELTYDGDLAAIRLILVASGAIANVSYYA